MTDRRADDREPAEGAVPISPATQIGRSKQTGDTPESGVEPGEEAAEGWPAPDPDAPID